MLNQLPRRQALLGLLAVAALATAGGEFARADHKGHEHHHADAAPGTASANGIAVHGAWARPSMGNMPNSAAYMTLEGGGAEPDELIAAASPAAERVELHTHLVENGIAKMRPVDGIEVVPGTATVLQPGGLHLMLLGLQQKLKEGDTLPMTLTFKHAGEVQLTVPVQAGASPHMMSN